MIVRLASLLLLVVAVTVAQPAPHSGLDGVLKTIKKEPSYATDRQLYGLMVFGPKAESCTWFVIDADVLYVDRDQDADLTDPDERVPAISTSTKADSLFDERRLFLVRDFRPGEKQEFRDLQVNLFFYNPRWQPPDARDDDGLRMVDLARQVRESPGAHQCTIWMGDDPALMQHVQVMMSERPTDAPIVHFDGPISLGLVEGSFPLSLHRGAVPAKITVALGTPGIGRGSFVRHPNTKIPDHLHPVGDFEFPPSEPGGKALRKKVSFKEKC